MLIKSYLDYLILTISYLPNLYFCFRMCLFSCFMPLVMIASVFSYGRYPEDLKFGILNFENLNFDSNNCSQTNIIIKDLSSEDMVR